MTSMHWEFIAAALREELGEYGCLLNLFDRQQQHIFQRDAAAVLQLAHEIETQARSLAGCRCRREQAVAALARGHGRPADSSLRSLLPEIDAEARPLLEALINEVNALLFRVRRVNRHNYSLLSRTVDVQQEVFQRLSPGAFTKTYSPGGRVAVAATLPPAMLRATG